MAKRVATDIARGKPKAAKTATGKDRCDRCYKVVYDKQASVEVNGRRRHSECWPAFMVAKRELHAAIEGLLDWDKTGANLEFEVPVCQYHQTVQQLEDKEYMMKQINCVSKKVRAELIETAGASQYVNVALALAAKALPAPSCAPPTTKKSNMTQEEYLTAAFELNGEEFLKFFEETCGRVFHNYEALCRDHGNLEDFRANPLVFILANEPACCTSIAKMFINMSKA